MLLLLPSLAAAAGPSPRDCHATGSSLPKRTARHMRRDRLAHVPATAPPARTTAWRRRVVPIGAAIESPPRIDQSPLRPLPSTAGATDPRATAATAVLPPGGRSRNWRRSVPPATAVADSAFRASPAAAPARPSTCASRSTASTASVATRLVTALARRAVSQAGWANACPSPALQCGDTTRPVTREPAAGVTPARAPATARVEIASLCRRARTRSRLPNSTAAPTAKDRSVERGSRHEAAGAVMKAVMGIAWSR